MTRRDASVQRAALLPVLVVGLIADQASTTRACIPGDRPHAIVSGLRAGAVARNDGALLNRGGGRTATGWVLGLFGPALVAWLVGCIRGDRTRRRGFEMAAAGLLLAGMLGNTADRLALGDVRDFLTSTAVPDLVFNLADLFIALGVLIHVGSRVARSARGPRRGLVVSK